MTAEKLREVAENLIMAVEGFPTEKNIQGVIDVFSGIKLGCDNVWENHLYKDINDLLVMNKTECPVCGLQLKLTRTRSTVLVKPC